MTMLRRGMLAVLALLAALSPVSAQQVTFNQRAAITTSGSGDQTIVAGVAGQRIALYGLQLVAVSSVAMTVKCGTTAQTGSMTLTVLSYPITPGSPPFFVCGAGLDLIVNLGTNVAAGGIAWYSQQ